MWLWKKKRSTLQRKQCLGWLLFTSGKKPVPVEVPSSRSMPTNKDVFLLLSKRELGIYKINVILVGLSVGF